MKLGMNYSRSLTRINTHTQNHTPERLPVHVFLRDSNISERFIPHWIERVTDCLRFQFIGLKDTPTDIVTNIDFSLAFDTAATRCTVVQKIQKMDLNTFGILFSLCLLANI